MSARAVFVTGTDTGVGKTLFAAALARHLSDKGLKVGVMKPVESGVEDVSRPGADAALLAWAARCEQPQELIAPYRLQTPVAPAEAASREQVRIVPSQIVDAFEALRNDSDFVIVEGAGGLMVPVAGGLLIADLIRLLQLPALFICRPNLGTINHTMLSLFAAQQLGLETCGYVINNMPQQPDLSEERAPHSLASLTTAELLGVTPHIATDNPQQAVAQLAAALAGLPTYPRLLAALDLPQARR